MKDRMPNGEQWPKGTRVYYTGTSSLKGEECVIDERGLDKRPNGDPWYGVTFKSMGKCGEHPGHLDFIALPDGSNPYEEKEVR